MGLGTVGIWLFGGRPVPAHVERTVVARLDDLGYGSAWVGEGVGGRDAFARSAVWLGATRRMAVGTGIANLWARQPETMQAGARTLAEAFDGRFLLGVGVGHAFQASSVGADFSRPLAHMRDYLSRMDAEAAANPPAAPVSRVLGAIGPKMLELARDSADGAHPFFTPVAHTAFAREILGPGKLLVPHQAVLLESDPARARAIAHEWVAQALAVPAYAEGWRRFGHTELNDELVDAAVAWGDESAIARRVREQLDAGADHVLVSPLGTDLPGIVEQLERLASALLAVRP
jgi:probable F420-dependent oxidoreductase